MTNKNKIIFLALTSIATCGVVFSTSANLKSVINTSGAGGTTWVHYSKVSASTTLKGIKEYWVSCSTNEHQFNAPSGVTIRDGGTPSRSFIDSLSSDDDRLIYPYTTSFDFDDGINSYITNYDYYTSIEVVDGEGIGGSKALRAINDRASDTDSHLRIDKGFLDYIFSDSKVKALSFYAKGTKVTNNFRHIQVNAQYVNGNSDIIACYERNNDGYGITNEYKQFFLTRGVYSQMNSSDWFIQYGGVSSSEALYLDNFSISYTDYYQFKKNSLEYGGLFLEENSTTYRLRSTPGNQADFNIINRIEGGFPTSGGSVGFDYVNYTDGYRSIKLTKPNGEFDYHAIGHYAKSYIQTTGGICFDIYSSIKVNASFDDDGDGYYERIGNYQDGWAGNTNNGSKAIHDGPILPNTWYTLYTPYDQISDNGRFFVITGSTAGSYSIDNIRIFDSTLYSNNGVIHLEDSTCNVLTSLNIDSLDSVSIDHVRVIATSNSNSSVTLSSSLFTEGYHEVVVTYYNNNQLICEHISTETVTMSTESAKNISLTYGNSGYYQLSGYSNIYRMMVGDKEVPFEVDGSYYQIPNAALMELLPTSNGQKVSGTLKLKMFSTTNKYVLPINITVSGDATVKSIPNYQGEGIGTHAYSSTNSNANRTTYKPYYDLKKIAEYQNTGLEILYEQAIGVGMYEYTLPDALTYLLDNAQKLNQKVLLVDSAFTLLSKYNRSIINEPLYDSIDAEGNPNTSGNKYTNSNIPSVDSVRKFTSTTDLDNFVEYRLNLYINHPACYGVSIGDEQFYDMLNGGFKDLMASIKRVLTKLNRQDFFLNCNLIPMTSKDYRYIGGTQSDTTSYSEANYKTYLDTFVACSGLDYIQFDIYPFASSDKGGNYESKGLHNRYLQNILIVAEYCKQHNLEFRMVTQSVTYYGTRVLDRKDIAWINNMVLGFGVKHVSYFVYCVRVNTGSETWIDDSAFLGTAGNRTDLYYYYQSAIEEINQFSPVISAFDYKWARLYRKSSYSTSTCYTNMMNSSYYSSSSSYGQLSGVTTSRDYTLATGLQNSSDNKYMYMVQNVYNNFSNKLLQTITLTFNQSYQYAVIYESGLPRVVTMNSTTLQLKLSSGRAAFVMVF